MQNLAQVLVMISAQSLHVGALDRDSSQKKSRKTKTPVYATHSQEGIWFCFR